GRRGVHHGDRSIVGEPHPVAGADRESPRTGPRMKLAALAVALLLAAPAAAGAKPLFVHWIDGTQASEPQMQVQRYDADTFVIRQSVKTNFEAPFLYLLFGNDRVLLLDTGAGGLKVRPTIDGVIADWLKAHHRASIPLVVAHSHSHGDHR